MQSNKNFLKMVTDIKDEFGLNILTANTIEINNSEGSSISSNMPLTKVIKINDTDANINNADVVIIYGQVGGNINNCENVVVINGQVTGDISNCKNVLGTLADISDTYKED